MAVSYVESVYSTYVSTLKSSIAREHFGVIIKNN